MRKPMKQREHKPPSPPQWIRVPGERGEELWSVHSFTRVYFAREGTNCLPIAEVETVNGHVRRLVGDPALELAKALNAEIPVVPVIRQCRGPARFSNGASNGRRLLVPDLDGED
jgi:hypothetical protein